jgi:hypothetical protein
MTGVASAIARKLEDCGKMNGVWFIASPLFQGIAVFKGL